MWNYFLRTLGLWFWKSDTLRLLFHWFHSRKKALQLMEIRSYTTLKTQHSPLQIVLSGITCKMFFSMTWGSWLFIVFSASCFHVLVLCCCHNLVATWWLTRAHMYPFTVLAFRSLTWDWSRWRGWPVSVLCWRLWGSSPFLPFPACGHCLYPLAVHRLSHLPSQPLLGSLTVAVFVFDSSASIF